MSDRIAVMRAGRIEQVGAPRQIYHAPTTEFVASFVGITNVLAGTVHQRQGAEADVLVGGSLVRVRTVRPVGTPVTLSLRPEALRVLRPGETALPGCRLLSGTLEETEYLGAVTRFSVRLAGGLPLQVMVLGRLIGRGEIFLAYDPLDVAVLEGP